MLELSSRVPVRLAQHGDGYSRVYASGLPAVRWGSPGCPLPPPPPSLIVLLLVVVALVLALVVVVVPRLSARVPSFLPLLLSPPPPPHSAAAPPSRLPPHLLPHQRQSIGEALEKLYYNDEVQPNNAISICHSEPVCRRLERATSTHAAVARGLAACCCSTHGATHFKTMRHMGQRCVS